VALSTSGLEGESIRRRPRGFTRLKLWTHMPLDDCWRSCFSCVSADPRLVSTSRLSGTNTRKRIPNARIACQLVNERNQIDKQGCYQAGIEYEEGVALAAAHSEGATKKWSNSHTKEHAPMEPAKSNISTFFLCTVGGI
jgi:hypothetical protein